MSLEKFNLRFIQHKQASILPRRELPTDTDEVVVDPRFVRTVVAAEQYASNSPDLFDAFRAGFLTTYLHEGEYNRAGAGENPRIVRQLKADTTAVEVMALYSVFTPELFDSRRITTASMSREDRSLQYVMTVAGNNDRFNAVSQRFQNDRDYASNLLKEEANDRHWAFLAGILSTQRGFLGILAPDPNHFPKGELNVLIEFFEESIEHQLLMKLVGSENIKKRNKQSQKGEKLCVNFYGEKAFEFIRKALSVSPILAETRPEILFLLFAGIDNKKTLNMEDYRNAYVEFQNSFYRGVLNQDNS